MSSRLSRPNPKLKAEILKELNSTRMEVAKLKDKIKSQNKKLRHLGKANKTLINEEDKLLADMEKLKRERDTFGKVIELKEQQIAAIRDSKSWRVMAFSRAMVNHWRNKTKGIVLLFGRWRFDKNNPEFKAFNNNMLASGFSEVKKARHEFHNQRASILDCKFLDIHSNSRQIDEADLPFVTVIFVTYNSSEYLETFFSSLVALDYPKTHLSIVAVDNGSSDNSEEIVGSFLGIIEAKYKKTQTIKQHNVGYGMGMHAGILVADSEFLLITNVDGKLNKNSLKLAAQIAKDDLKEVASWEFRQLPFEHPKYYDPVTCLTNWSTHACILMRRESYLSVGGYEPNIFMYGEDVELSYRLRKKGFLLRYIPNAIFEHDVSFDSTRRKKNQFIGSISSNLLLRYRYGRAIDVLIGEAQFNKMCLNEVDPEIREYSIEIKAKLDKYRWAFFKEKFKWKRNDNIFFPFSGFDYDFIREGAAVPVNDLSEKEGLPLVSVITRTYGKTETHLVNCISAVLNQTYPNIEHIIVEDKTDDAKELVLTLQKRFGKNRIKYYKSPYNGRSSCGNYGAQKSKGSLLCWLDCDDVFFADHIEVLYNGFLKTPSANCSYSIGLEALAESKDGHVIYSHFNIPAEHLKPYDKLRLQTMNYIPIQAMMFTREIFESAGGFNEDIEYLEDWNLWVRYSQYGSFVFTPKVTSLYITPANTSERHRRQLLLDLALSDVSTLNNKFINFTRVKPLKPKKLFPS